MNRRPPGATRTYTLFPSTTLVRSSDVADYVDIRRELEAGAGHVNGAFAEYDWAPIRYLNKSFSRRALAGFFRAARVGLVTPLRDGMNLVAKEFVAAQSEKDPGVLVLSRFAGAALELDGAIIVNPFDVEGVRSEEHTSELQSLMRISYAVFCL